MTIIAAACGATTAVADTIWFRDVAIPLREVDIDRILDGQVRYLDGSGRSQLRPVATIEAIVFDDIATIGVAEERVRAGERDAAIALLLKALVTTSEDDPRRLWVHARLARLHAANEQPVAAMSHAAEVFARDDAPDWVMLEPRLPDDEVLDRATPALCHEARDAIRRAQRRVRSADLSRALERMRGHLDKRVRGVADPRREQTFSGLTAGEITDRRITDLVKVDMPESPTDGPVVRGEIATRSEIDRLLDDGRFDEALAACERLAADPGDRDPAVLLVQFGRALDGAGRHDDAAIRYSQAVIHFPTTRSGAWAHVRLARQHLAHDWSPDVVPALLDRATFVAQSLDDAALVVEIKRMRSTMESASSR